MYENHDNEAITLLFASTALILLMVVTLVFIVLFQQKRKHLHRQQLKDMGNQYEKALLQSELKVQAETFEAISQNLHDNIGSNISTAMLLLYKDDHIDSREEEANRKEALHMLGTVVDDLKNISRSLNPRFLEEIGLNEAIRHRMQQLQRSGKYEIDLWLEPMPRALNRQKQLILFYIFQEAINNINKHARARRIEVKIAYDHGNLEMNIKDDGLGINNPGSNKVREKGSGLINMKSHAGIMGARLEIRSEQKQGTEVFVSIPDPYA